MPWSIVRTDCPVDPEPQQRRPDGPAFRGVSGAGLDRAARLSESALGQFQYPTVPLHVHESHIEQVWMQSNQRVAARLAGVKG